MPDGAQQQQQGGQQQGQQQQGQQGSQQQQEGQQGQQQNSQQGQGQGQQGQQGSQQQNSQQGQQGQGQGQQRVVPETYELKLPKGASLDNEAVTRAATKFKELGLTQEEASKAFEYVHSEVKGQQDRAQAAWNELSNKWLADAKSDKEIGGANYDAAVRRAGLVLGKFGTPALLEQLDKGWGNHPELIRLLARVAEHFDEADLLPNQQSEDGGKKNKSTAEVLYGGSQQQ